MKIVLKKIFLLFVALMILIAPFFFFSEYKILSLYIWVISIVYFLFIKEKIKLDDVSRETSDVDNE